MAQPYFRLTIYRFAPTSRALRYFAREEDVFDLSLLGEVVYSWATTLLIWDAIEDKNATAEVRSLLSNFDGTGRPGYQSVRDLWPVLQKLEALRDKEAWMNANSSRSLAEIGHEEFDDELRVKPALAFAHHLRWICESFGETPDLVVVYR